jgi:hypothetical protein
MTALELLGLLAMMVEAEKKMQGDVDTRAERMYRCSRDARDRTLVLPLRSAPRIASTISGVTTKRNEKRSGVQRARSLA